LTVFDKIDYDYEPWKMYHDEKDILEPTHSLVDADGPADLYCVAIEVPQDEKMIKLMKWMTKEIDTATRFSLTDGKIQVEIEVWDEDFDDKLYFASNLTLKQCHKIIKNEKFNMGFVLIGHPNAMVAGVKMFNKKDLVRLVKIKQSIDARVNRPPRWIVG